MIEASVVMDEFMRQLSNNEFKKDIYPDNLDQKSEDEPYFVDEHMYVKFLKSGLLDAVLDDSVV